MGSSSPTPIPFFFPLLFFSFFFQQNNFKNFKIANQSGTHTMPKPATFHPPMTSYNVFHRRVERPSIAGIGSVPEVTLKKEGFCRVLVIAVDFLNLIGSVSESYPTYSWNVHKTLCIMFSVIVSSAYYQHLLYHMAYTCSNNCGLVFIS